MKQHVTWTKEKDIELVRLMMKGMTQEGIAEEMSVTVNNFANRICKLGLRLSHARQAKRDGLGVLDYLARSPQYAPTDEPKEASFPVSHSFSFGSFIYIPDEFANDPDYLRHAADKMVESARILLERAKKLHQIGEAA